MNPPAKFPTSIWDGTSPTRPLAGESGQAAIDTYREPDGGDYAQAQAEIIALETAVTRNRLISGSPNTAALATTATAGHGYLPTCAGTPTGVPAAITGFAAMIYDTTAHKLWIYDAGWKTGGAIS